MFSTFKASILEKRKKHAEEIQQFMLEAHKKIDTAFLTESGISIVAFFNSLKELSQKWFGTNAAIGDCDGSRLVNKILHKEISNPIFHSIIADRLDIFFKYYHAAEIDKNHPPIFWLEVACICGAQNIVRYLLGNVGCEVWKGSKNIIPYLLSSGNSELTIEVAQMAKTLSVQDVGLIDLYSFGHTTTVEKIRSLFETSTVQPKL